MDGYLELLRLTNYDCKNFKSQYVLFRLHILKLCWDSLKGTTNKSAIGDTKSNRNVLIFSFFLNILLNPQVDRSSIKPYFANLTIGAGAVAFILSHASLVRRNCPKLLHAIVETDSNHSELCKGDTTPEEGLAMETNSEQLLIAGINVAKRAWNKFKSETRWSESTPDNIICHQVGRTHQRKLYDALNLDLNKDYSTSVSYTHLTLPTNREV